MKKFVAIMLVSVLALGCLAGCGSKNEDTVMTVDGVDVSFDEYMYYLNTAASTLISYYQASTGGGVDWDGVCIYDKTKTNAEWCINEALYNAAQGCVIMSKGKSMNALPTDEQLKSLEDNISTIRKNYEESDDPDAAFADALNGQGFTLESFKAVNKINFTLGNIFTSLYGENGEKLSEEKLQNYIEENGYMTSAHILFRTKEDVKGENGQTTQEELSDSAKAEKKAQAEKLCKELKAIKDDTQRKEKFFEYMKEYSEDPGKESFPNGYCFTEGTMVEEYTDTTKELKNYEVSDVVESDFGYHIIMRLPTVSSDVDTANQYGYTLGQMASSYDFDEEMKTWDVTDKAKFNSKYKSFDFTQFFGDAGFTYTTYAKLNADKK